MMEDAELGVLDAGSVGHKGLYTFHFLVVRQREEHVSRVAVSLPVVDEVLASVSSSSSSLKTKLAGRVYFWMEPRELLSAVSHFYRAGIELIGNIGDSGGSRVDGYLGAPGIHPLHSGGFRDDLLGFRHASEEPTLIFHSFIEIPDFQFLWSVSIWPKNRKQLVKDYFNFLLSIRIFLGTHFIVKLNG